MKSKIVHLKVVSKTLDYDRLISESIYSFRIKNKFLEKTVKLLSRGYGLLPLFALQIIFSNYRFQTLFAFLVQITIAAVFVELLLKHTFKRRRPSFSGKSFKTYSFPSTHATATVANLVYFLATYYMYSNQILILILSACWVVIVCISRVVYGYHYFVDVVLGVGVGFLIGVVFSLINV
jgi:undecaprenyl-diphosphatase